MIVLAIKEWYAPVVDGIKVLHRKRHDHSSNNELLDDCSKEPAPIPIEMPCGIAYVTERGGGESVTNNFYKFHRIKPSHL